MEEKTDVLYILLCQSCGKTPKIKILFPEGTGNEIKISYTCHESDKVISINEFIKLFKQRIIEKATKCCLCFDDGKPIDKSDDGLSCLFCLNYFCKDDKLYHLLTTKHKDPLKCKCKDDNENKLERKFYCSYCAERICSKCKEEHEKLPHKVTNIPLPPAEIEPIKRLLYRYSRELRYFGDFIEKKYNTNPYYKDFEKCHNNFSTLIDCFIGSLIFFNNKEIYRPECIENVKEISIKVIEAKDVNDSNIDECLKNFNERIKIVNKFTSISQIIPENIKERPNDIEDEDNIEKNNNIKDSDDINVILKDYHIYDTTHRDFIRAVRVFKSKKIVSISDDQSISIWDGKDNNYRHLQTLEFVHANLIFDLCLYDEGNVEKIITCSNDQCIKIHKFNQAINQFEWEETIPEAHDDDINKVICLSNGIIISCSDDKTIRIWKNEGNFYKCINILNQNLKVNLKENNENKETNYDPYYYNQVQNIFLCDYKDEFFLFSSGINGSRKWIFKNLEGDLEKQFDDSKKNNEYYDMVDVQCTMGDTIQRLGVDIVIFGGGYDNEMSIVAIDNNSYNKYIVYKIKNPFTCKGILVFNDIFFVVGTNSKILRYRKDNYDCLNPINENDEQYKDKKEHERDINGLTKVDNAILISFSDDRRMKLWEIS